MRAIGDQDPDVQQILEDSTSNDLIGAHDRLPFQHTTAVGNATSSRDRGNEYKA